MAEPIKLQDSVKHGGVSEWSNVPPWKGGIPKGIAGSNPVPSATLDKSRTHGNAINDGSMRQSTLSNGDVIAFAIV